MPTYEFACPQGHRFDKFYRKISDSVATLPCPECGEEAVRQLSGGAGLIFKGSGFYITDYGKDGKKSTTAPDKAGEKGDAKPAKPEGSSGGDAPSKPAAPSGGGSSSSGKSGDG